MNKSNNIVAQSQYNEDPVVYCKHCLSLAIKTIGEVDFCDKCGSIDTEQIDIHNWEILYKQKFGVEYLKTKKR